MCYWEKEIEKKKKWKKYAIKKQKKKDIFVKKSNTEKKEDGTK